MVEAGKRERGTHSPSALFLIAAPCKRMLDTGLTRSVLALFHLISDLRILAQALLPTPCVGHPNGGSADHTEFSDKGVHQHTCISSCVCGRLFLCAFFGGVTMGMTLRAGVTGARVMGAMLAMGSSVALAEANSISEVVTGGKAGLDLRYRYEYVDQDGIDKSRWDQTQAGTDSACVAQELPPPGPGSDPRYEWRRWCLTWPVACRSD